MLFFCTGTVNKNISYYVFMWTCKLNAHLDWFLSNASTLDIMLDWLSFNTSTFDVILDWLLSNTSCLDKMVGWLLSNTSSLDIMLYKNDKNSFSSLESVQECWNYLARWPLCSLIFSIISGISARRSDSSPVESLGCLAMFRNQADNKLLVQRIACRLYCWSSSVHGPT